jgi:hypothetical protein
MKKAFTAREEVLSLNSKIQNILLQSSQYRVTRNAERRCGFPQPSHSKLRVSYCYQQMSAVYGVSQI